jgi:hypothetical protein
MAMPKLAIVLGLLAAPVFGAPITITLIPGDVLGVPGGTVGWGYTIDNPTTDYLSQFTVFFNDIVPSFGAYTDFLSLRSPIGPGITTVAFDPVAAQNCANAFTNCDNAGLGAYVIDPGSPAGTQDTGTFQITYIPYTDDTASTVDTTLDPTSLAIPLQTSSNQDPAFTITATPEPGTISTVGVAAGLLGVFGWKRRRLKCI